MPHTPGRSRVAAFVRTWSLSIVLAHVLTNAATAQGLTLRDTTFVAALSRGSHPAPVGGGTTIPEPTVWWTMDETGNVDRTDSISSVVLVKTSGTVASPAGLYGNAASFTNVSGALDTSGGSPGTGVAALAYTAGNDISISYWINFKSTWLDTHPTIGFFVSNSDGSIVPGHIQVQGDSGPTVYFSVDDDVGGNYDDVTVNPFTYTQDVWYHFVLIYTAATDFLSLYRDGTLVGTTDFAVGITTTTHGRLRISQGSSWTRAWIDEVGIWMDHKLTTDEIDALYNAGAGVTYPF